MEPCTKTKNLSELVYSELKEEDAVKKGWEKETVAFALKRKSFVTKAISGIAKKMNFKLYAYDIEDIYTDIIEYLYNNSDYDIEKAYNIENDNCIPIEGYIYSCTKYCTMRFMHKKCKRESILVSEYTVSEDGEEVSVFNTIADKDKKEKLENIEFSIKDILRAYESQRYTFGPDIFQIWFIRLKTISLGKKELYSEIISVLGIDKKDILNMESMSDYEGAMNNIAKAVTICGIEKALQEIRRYTYCANRLEQVIESYVACSN